MALPLHASSPPRRDSVRVIDRLSHHLLDLCCTALLAILAWLQTTTPTASALPPPSPMPRVAIILGSLRRPGNGYGIATSWLLPVLRHSFNDPKTPSAVDVVLVDPTKPPFPLGPLTDGSHVPAEIRDPTKHPHPSVREFATFVSSCSGLVFLSPEYNGHYPGELKNTLDHLYWEWKQKPAMVVTYGGSGGLRCAAVLRSLLGGPFNMNLVQHQVALKWPKGSDTVPAYGQPPEWLHAFEPDVRAAVEEMKSLMIASSNSR